MLKTKIKVAQAIEARTKRMMRKAAIALAKNMVHDDYDEDADGDVVDTDDIQVDISCHRRGMSHCS